MFHVDITAEDTRLIATESFQDDVQGFKVLLTDNLSGRQHVIPFATFCQLEKLAKGMICCHEALTESEYKEMEKLLEGCPNECRPIP